MSGTHEEKNGVAHVQKVHLAPLWSVGVGVARPGRRSAVSARSRSAGGAPVSSTLSCRTPCSPGGCADAEQSRFGPANAVTALRSTLVGLVTALVATSFTPPISVPLLIGLTVPALALGCRRRLDRAAHAHHERARRAIRHGSGCLPPARPQRVCRSGHGLVGARHRPAALRLRRRRLAAAVDAAHAARRGTGARWSPPSRASPSRSLRRGSCQGVPTSS